MLNVTVSSISCMIDARVWFALVSSGSHYIVLSFLPLSLASYTLLHLGDSFMHADSNMSDGFDVVVFVAFISTSIDLKLKVRVNSIPRMTDGMSSLSPFQRATWGGGGGGGVKLTTFIPYYDSFVKAASNELDVVGFVAFISPWVELKVRVNSSSYMTDEMSILSPFQRATGGGGGEGHTLHPLLWFFCASCLE